MKTIGLLGGMSWESTLPYYRIINQQVQAALGGLHSARILLYSVDFDEIAQMQREGRWDDAGVLLSDAARALQGAGAELLLLCTNTMHKVAPMIEAAVSIPLLHIVDTLAARLREAGHARVGLLGTRFTMEEPFYRDRLRQAGIEACVPGTQEREAIHRTIFDELCRGRILDASRERLLAIIEGLADAGAEAIVFGCTEIGLLLDSADAPLPVFDTTRIHAEAAACAALQPDPA